jgi:hypothetical protein
MQKYIHILTCVDIWGALGVHHSRLNKNIIFSHVFTLGKMTGGVTDVICTNVYIHTYTYVSHTYLNESFKVSIMSALSPIACVRAFVYVCVRERESGVCLCVLVCMCTFMRACVYPFWG